MGCVKSKAAAFQEEQEQREEAAMGPPSKIMDASEYCGLMLAAVRPTLEVHLATQHLNNLKATQFMTRSVSNGDNGTMYYIKASTGLSDWPWIFVKVWEPPSINTLDKPKFKGMKKMDQEYKLVIF